jgi:hypothetical protein
LPTPGINETAEPISLPPTSPAPATDYGDVRQRVVAQQLELMSRQLDVLRQRRAGAGKS